MAVIDQPSEVLMYENLSPSDSTELHYDSNELQLKYLTRACRLIGSFSTKWTWVIKILEPMHTAEVLDLW